MFVKLKQVKLTIPLNTEWRRETGKFEIIRKNEGNLQNFI
jgi:hypothetical protein